MSPEKALPFKALRLVPLGLFLFAFLIRLAGIGWGLPNELHSETYHPDEPQVLGYALVIDASHGSWMPGVYNYGTFFPLVESVAIGISDLVAGQPQDVVKLKAQYYMTGRIVSALAGAGTVAVVFLLLLEFTSIAGAVAGAMLMCFAPAHVVHSRFDTVDVMATFLLALSLLYAVRFVSRAQADVTEKRLITYACLAGVFAGLSAGTKYTGGLAVLGILAAILIARKGSTVLQGAIAVLSCLLAFAASTPGVIFDRADFMRDFGYEMRHTASGHGLVFVGTSSGFVYHIGNLIIGIGFLATALGTIALLYAAYRRHPWAFVLLAFAIPYYLVIGRADVKFLRYTFPLYVCLAAGVGYAVGTGHRKGGYSRAAVALGILAIGGADGALAGLRGTAVMTGWMIQPDPRTTAALYLKSNADTVGLVSDPWFYSPPIYPSAGDPRTIPAEQRDQAMMAATHPAVQRYIPPGPEPRKDWDSRLITELKPETIVYSSFEAGDLERLSNETGLSPDIQAQVNDYKAFMDLLRQQYTLEKQFGEGNLQTHDLEYIQPWIRVWKRITPS